MCIFRNKTVKAAAVPGMEQLQDTTDTLEGKDTKDPLEEADVSLGTKAKKKPGEEELGSGNVPTGQVSDQLKINKPEGGLNSTIT